jgi:hypothetical protein
MSPQKGFGFCCPQIAPMDADSKKLKAIFDTDFTDLFSIQQERSD